MCNAILNSFKHESKDSVDETTPLGLSVHVTPVLTRHKGMRHSKSAVTAQSIKHHKWQHSSEEISGDYKSSLHQEGMRLGYLLNLIFQPVYMS